MHVSLPPPLKEWVEEQILQHGYGTASEYIRQLLRQEQQRQARLAVEAKLREALESGEPVPVTEKTWTQSHKRVEERLKSAHKKRKGHGTHR